MTEPIKPLRKFTNGLTDAEVERLAILSEEMGEAQQIIGKILRHGYESVDPTILTYKKPPTNRELLEKELGHVNFSIRMMQSRDDIDFDAMKEHCEEKVDKVSPYLHHQEDR